MANSAQVKHGIQVTPLTIFIALCIGHQTTAAAMDGFPASLSDAVASFIGTSGFCSLLVAICTSLTEQDRGVLRKGFFAYRWWILFALIGFASHFQDPWSYRNIALPDNFGQLTIGVRSTHPYLNECEYRAFVKRPDGTLIKFDIFPNTGGSSSLKLFWYPSEGGVGPILRIVHLLSDDDLVDVSTGATYVEDSTPTPPGYKQVQAIVGRSRGISLGEFTEQWKYKPAANKIGTKGDG